VGVCKVEFSVTRCARVSAVRRLPFGACRPSAEHAHVAQSVEHVLGKDEVTSSILVVGSNR
jgi:hypothetical protein